MQNPLLKFRQSSIISEEPGYLSGKLKTLMGSNCYRVQWFFPEILHVVPTFQCLQKGDQFFFCFDLELLQVRKKCPYSELFWSAFFPHLAWIRRDTEYLSVFSPDLGKCGENADQNNSEYGHLLHCVINLDSVSV